MCQIWNLSISSLLAVLGCFGAGAQTDSACGTPFTLTTEHLSVPITVINDFIFLQAEVNGIHGKIMFDTGTPEALVLNDHLLEGLGPGKVEGQALVGSGQMYTITTRTCVHAVSVGGAPPRDMPLVESNDLGFIEKDITPDFLGFVGYQAFAGSTFELDYVRRRLEFEKNVKGSRPALLNGQTVLATLPFTTRRRPNSPLISVKLGGQTFLGTFDTGQSGSLEMSDALRESLVHAGSLVPLPGRDDDGNVVYRVKDVELTHGVHISLPAMTIHPIHSPSDKGIGITEHAVIHLGFQMLSQFKTVWDWPNHTIYLVKA